MKLLQKLLLVILITPLTVKSEVGEANYPIDFDKTINLDAENLGELGISEAYERLIPELSKYIEKPEPIKEIINSSLPKYEVLISGIKYKVYDQSTSQLDSYVNAQYIFFKIVNIQLKDTKYKFYALYGWNDLQGIFLTQEEYEHIINSIKKKSEWPYLPTLREPHYGQAH
ncbi:MAG: hypothetical protein HWE27_03835 [Gammaproteobacteria bacterium]|nr:hypothetical protein [Gammaproteobacteria bacterium]